ncbi:hypothetical protein PG988_005389 [Apiospora saccharicola]
MQLRKPDLLPGDDPMPRYRHLDLALASPLFSLPVPSPSGVGVRFADNPGYLADEEDEDSSPISLTFELIEAGRRYRENAIPAVAPQGLVFPAEFTMDVLLRDESGGGAPLHSPPSSSSTNERNRQMASSKSDSPSDEELALVRASSQFAKQGGKKFANQGPNPFVSTGPSNFGQHHGAFGHQTPRPGTAMPRHQNFGSQNFGNQNNFMTSPPPQRPHRNAVGPAGNNRGGIVSTPITRASHHGHSPLFTSQHFQECANIQERLVTIQQYIRVSPGISSDLANNVQNQLITIGQELNAFFHNASHECQKAQYQAGELRVHMETMQQELLARKKQIDEFKTAYSKSTNDNDGLMNKNRELAGRLGDSQAQNAQLKSTIQGQDMRHMAQVQNLENEIKALRMSGDNPMQLIKVDEPNKEPRRGSGLNPTAPAFGPRANGGQSDKGKGNMPMPEFPASSATTVTPYNHHAGPSNVPERPLTPLAKKPNFGRQMPPQDARTYESGYQQSARNRRVGSIAASTSGQSAFVSNHSSQRATAMSTSNVLTPYKDGLSEAIAKVDDYSDIIDWEPADIQNGFGRLYEMMEGLVATQHCNPPFNDVDKMLHRSHPDTWNYILAMGLPNPMQSATHMSHLLGDSHCRHFVIKRVVVDYLFNCLISPDAFREFSDEMDGHLEALQEKMRGKIPGNVRPQGDQRQRLIEDHAKLIKHIVYSPEGEEFRDRSVTKHVNILSTILRPMRNCTISDEAAQKTLRIIMNYAFTVTSKLWTSSMTIHYFFPETGSKFSAGQMRPMNHLEIPPEQLQYSQWRVMLVVCPTLSLRDDRDRGSLRTHELMKADVLVMK